MQARQGMNYCVDLGPWTLDIFSTLKHEPCTYLVSATLTDFFEPVKALARLASRLDKKTTLHKIGKNKKCPNFPRRF